MTVAIFGDLDGAPVLRATLSSDVATVSFLSYGAVLQDWRVNGRDGTARPVVLGFPTFAPYPVHSRSFGVIAGRIANRVREGRFALGGESVALDRNHGAHHLHGGREGFGKTLWSLEADGAARLRLAKTSPDGHMGYPGNLAVTATVTLDGPSLTYAIEAVPDRPTPVALATHSYFALGGEVAKHRLSVPAGRHTVLDADKVPTGELAAVDGTRLDFRTGRSVGDEPLDNNLCLDPDRRVPAATLVGEDFTLTVETDRPGLQLYNAYDFPVIPEMGHDGAVYGPLAGLALEPQDWPDAVNNPAFPSVLATPDAPYRQRTRLTIVPTDR